MKSKKQVAHWIFASNLLDDLVFLYIPVTYYKILFTKYILPESCYPFVLDLRTLLPSSVPVGLVELR